jgi:hypothetical protein
MSHPSSDAVIDFLQVCQHQIALRIGADFRNPNQPPPSLSGPLAARNFPVQVATPPPSRTDGSGWQVGLALPNGADFDPAGNDWTQFGVQPRVGTKPLVPPLPAHLIYNQTIQAPLVPPTSAATSVFALTAPGAQQPSNHCLSVPYVAQPVGGKQLTMAAVNYFYAGTLPLVPAPQVDDWIAISPDKFTPGRASADYIAKVVDCHGHHVNPAAPGQPRAPEEIVGWWSLA